MTARTPADCEGKVRFTSFARAEAAAARKPQRRAYACRVCQGFHVGGTRPGEPKRKRPRPAAREE
jgi:hypothetical protein